MNKKLPINSMNNEERYVYAVEKSSCTGEGENFVCFASKPYFTSYELEKCLGEAAVKIDKYIDDLGEAIHRLDDEDPDFENFRYLLTVAEESQQDGCTYAVVDIGDGDTKGIAYYFFHEDDQEDTINDPNFLEEYTIRIKKVIIQNRNE